MRSWPIRDLIMQSWRRVASSGLRPDQFDPPYDPDLDAGERLDRVAGPIIRRLADDLAGTSVGLIVTDHQAHVLMRRVSDRSLARRLDSILLAPGFSYREDHTGTNAIGTALAVHEPTVVWAREHYAHALTGMACAATPIFDPSSGAVVGIVDLTSYAVDANSLMLPLAKRATWEIEQALLAGATARERVLQEAFLRARRRAKHPFVLVGEHTMRANAAGTRILQSPDQGRLWHWAVRALATDGFGLSELLLDGATLPARCEPVRDGDLLVGVIVHLGRPRAAVNGMSGRATLGWGSLTETEHSVAALVARGLTNREAAAQLFLSRHTIGSHLRHIFRKLDVTSRVELTRVVVTRAEPESAALRRP